MDCPSLYFYDDGEFTEQNQESISYISSEGKLEDVSKTGKVLNYKIH